MTRILQFTDLHFRQALAGHSGHCERLSRHGPALLAMLKTRIAQENPDLVAFTGDIIDAPHELLHGSGSEADRAPLVTAARQDYVTMRAWLDSLGRPWMIAPGNHDFRPVFLDVFADAAREISLPHVTALSYFDWEVRDNTAERVGEERARFDAALAGNQPGWTVHLQHYLIWPEVEHRYPMRYREADELRDRLAAAEGRHLVLCGHFHGGTDIVRLGNGHYGACRSITEAPHHYRVFDITADGCTMREEHLPSGPLVGQKLVLVDRSGLLTDEGVLLADDCVTKAGIADFFATLRDAGYQPVFVCAWNDPASAGLAWADLLKRHDRLFLALAAQGHPQGAGLVIALDEERPLPSGLPFEPLPRYGNLAGWACARYGTRAGDIRFLSRDASRRRRFGENLSLASLDRLAAELSA